MQIHVISFKYILNLFLLESYRIFFEFLIVVVYCKQFYPYFSFWSYIVIFFKGPFENWAVTLYDDDDDDDNDNGLFVKSFSMNRCIQKRNTKTEIQLTSSGTSA